MARVAALQFASGTDVAENLANCLRMIDTAQADSPQLLVLPEFCNHISWYDDAEHAWAVSVELEGEFLGEIAARAQKYGCYIVINVSLRRDPGEITVTSLCYDPQGRLCASADKQTLMGHENTWFVRARQTGEVVDAPFGRFAMFPCRDGVTCETPRALALRGAQLFCDSLNSFALDEASLHVPARAPENKVFLVAANKVGPLIPEHLLEPVSEQTHIPLQFLNGAGESQIVDPDGKVLAKGPREGEAVVIADIELYLANNKTRPDGTDLFESRRPWLYQAIAQEPQGLVCGPAAEEITVACLSPEYQGERALAELPGLVQALPQDTALAVLPELFCHEPSSQAGDEARALLGEMAIDAMQDACAQRPGLALCASIYRRADAGVGVTAVLVDTNGLISGQPRLHGTAGDEASTLGDKLSLVDMPWGRLAIMSGHDAIFPELIKVAAIQGAHVLALPSRFLEDWEEAYGLRSRAAENRLCVVASSWPLNNRAGLIADLESEFTLMTEWKERRFDGYINVPLVTEQRPGETVTVARIHPAAASDKLMSERTDLILDRPWRLSGDLLLSAKELQNG